MAAHKIDERRGARDVASDRAEGLAEGALDYRRAMHDSVALGNAAAAPAVEADGVHLVEISHCPKTIGDIAQFADRRDVPVHRADRFEAHKLWRVRGHSGEQSSEVGG